MARALELTGQRFGRLVALEYAGSVATKRHGRETKQRTWRCHCDCGGEKTVEAYRLMAGAVQSCGCLQQEERKRRGDAVAVTMKARAIKRLEEILAAGGKKCPKCEQFKSLGDFPRDPTKLARLGGTCRQCLIDYAFTYKYGIALADKKAMIAAQGSKCAIHGCGRAVNMTTGHLDHCHESGQVRAVLCGKCNSALGYLGEDPRRIEGLAAYARQWKQLRLIPGGKA